MTRTSTTGLTTDSRNVMLMGFFLYNMINLENSWPWKFIVGLVNRLSLKKNSRPQCALHLILQVFIFRFKKFCMNWLQDYSTWSPFAVQWPLLRSDQTSDLSGTKVMSDSWSPIVSYFQHRAKQILQWSMGFSFLHESSPQSSFPWVIDGEPHRLSVLTTQLLSKCV